jgi:hypothetical protein
MGPKVGKEVLVGGQLEVFAANFHGQDFFIGQSRGKPTPPQGVPVFNRSIVLTNQTVHGNDKIISIHWVAPSVNSVCGSHYSTKKLPNGSSA